LFPLKARFLTDTCIFVHRNILDGPAQESISDDAKNLRAGKNLHAKKSLDRLAVVQRDVQAKNNERFD
jgi:hypothetical protein